MPFSITFICELCRAERRARDLMIGPAGEQACNLCMCNTEGCRNRAVVVAHWPGSATTVPRSVRLCAECGDRATLIAADSGVYAFRLEVLR